MPTINVSKKDMEKLLGRKLPSSADKLDDIFQYVGCEVEVLAGDEIQLEVKSRNRPDLWCAEGIARDLRGALDIQTGRVKPVINSSKYEVNIDPDMKNVRPFIACAVLKGVKLSGELIRQIMQQQEKIDGTYGRNRKKTSIGLYDVDLIDFPLTYTTVTPNGIKFVPLDFEIEMTPEEILENHPKGMNYKHLVEHLKRYPIFKDVHNKVLSFPPIINSNDLGKLTEKSTNILIEVTGTNYVAVKNVLKIMALSLAERGGTICEVKINYPYRLAERTPNYSPSNWVLPIGFTNKWLGLNLTGKEMAALLQKARYGIKKIKRDKIIVQVPAYRTDVLHIVDLIEDIAIMYGYSNFEPMRLDVATTGELAPLTKFSNKVRELMLGFGGQEIQTFTLTDPDIFTKKINYEQKLVAIENPMSQTYSALRTEIWPMLLNFLSKNTNREYPQKIFEVGDVVAPNPKAETKSDTLKHLAFALASKEANFTYAKQVLCSLLASLGAACEVKEIEHNSFIAGRVGEIFIGGKQVGLVGEIHPSVLENFGIEMPVCVFEVDLNSIS